MDKEKNKPAALLDQQPEPDQFRMEVLDGLSRKRKTLPCKYFYDERGSKLFDAICELEEYYLTRTELAIMEDHAAAMAERIGPACVLIELGSGSSIKTRILLSHLDHPAMYVPVDISREHLLQSVKALEKLFPSVPIQPVCADFNDTFELPNTDGIKGKFVIYFPGSTIGNLEPAQAVDFLQHLVDLKGHVDGMLIGVDLKKDREFLEPAYNDSQQVTAAFNLNLLVRINRELGADFQVDQFRHFATYNEQRGCMEIFLISEREQTVRVADQTVGFQPGERILTERSYKYSLADFSRLATAVGAQVDAVWTDPEEMFSLQYLTLPV